MLNNLTVPRFVPGAPSFEKYKKGRLTLSGVDYDNDSYFGVSTGIHILDKKWLASRVI
ncbi:hypothetical protein [Thiospirochaeta perfilievii]|uniref:hypothetical protein n=1 Tax=Thiospirochaeta perfilievii TaxID=252967 RepID=UPI001659316C|nr:hypothetical protein [Thiospirochaeta perfilievii]